MLGRRRFTAVGAVLLSAALTVATAGAAEAVAAFSPVRTVGNGCSFAHSATSSTGQTRGVMGCDSASGTELVLFRGDGASPYTRIRTGVLGTPLAFADDGTSYYAVYQADTSASRTVVKLLKRNRSSGRTTTKTLVSKTYGFTPGAAIVAARGKYWAAVSEANQALQVRTHTRQTLDPALPAMKVVEGWQPALALRGSNRVTMVVSDSMLGSGATIVRYLPRADGTWTRTTIRSGGFLPAVQYSGGVTRIAWLELVKDPGVYAVWYADDASGAFSRRKVPGPAAFVAGSPAIAVDQGRLTVAWTARNPDGGVSWTRAGVAQRVGSTWTTLTVGHGLTDASLAGLGAWNGKVITVMAGSGGGRSKVTSRRQP